MSHSCAALCRALLVLALVFVTSLSGAPEAAPAEKKRWSWGDPLRSGPALLDLEVRERFEWRDNWIDFHDAVDARDDVALLQRLRVGLELQATEDLVFYGQMQDSRTFFDESAGPVSNREFIVNDSPADLRQAWARYDHLLGQDLSVKVGRQVLSYGKQRLIGGFEWDNNARTFDAVRATYTTADLTVDYFAGYVVLHKTDDFNTSDSEDLLTGVYATYNGWNLFSIDAYALGRSKSDVETSTVFTHVEQTDGNTSPAGDYATLGTVWQSKKDAFGPWDANAELALQAGEISNPTGFGPVVAGNPVNIQRQDLLAFASHIEGGYTFLTAHGRPRLYFEYNYSTGDGDPGDGTSHTFQNLFPTNHVYYGDMDRFSWQNMHNPAGGIQWKPTDTLSLKAACHLFWLADTDDVWRFAGQGAVGGAGRYGNALNRNPSSFVGSELNLNLRYQPAKGLAIEGGYAHFFAGGYIGDTMPVADVGGDDADFAYVQILWQF